MHSIEKPAEDSLHEGDPTLPAREIARMDGFEHALATLREQGLLRQEVERVQAQYEKHLVEPESFMTEAAWEAFAVMELFDPETAKHCVETYRLAHGKIERRLSGSDVLFSELFAEEHQTLPVFYRACLLHDIGKVHVPYEIIHNTVTDHECAELLLQHQEYLHASGDAVALGSDPDVVLHLLEATGHRPKDIAPAVLLLSPQVAQALTARGIDVEQTVAELIRPHEAYSASILTALGFEAESKLAARHHNYKDLPVEFPLTVGGLEVSVDLAEILHLADVEQAMEAERSYKPSSTTLEAMLMLVHHVENGIVKHADITAVWVCDEIEQLYPGVTDFAAVCTAAECEQLTVLIAFLEKHTPVHLGEHVVPIRIPSLLPAQN